MIFTEGEFVKINLCYRMGKKVPIYISKSIYKINHITQTSMHSWINITCVYQAPRELGGRGIFVLMKDLHKYKLTKWDLINIMLQAL